uniref:Glycosyl transferase CAP10 domain-containing protein n=1 Tax=Chromera velia CCMP2878 TaxID=1169474 RepID=A0A0G4GZ52_9ALVE|eukprot:Cvel_23987.t1-p1 / transcript=Cvel_23987.t1 / gene=Cvel_23987 / organism=Chromera_velia_CCMP2878 / gene_product=KDEL motif-containing protein 1, putative / transcript_product=KDEL motif-containing protein 1, putative / location=Cvel_scaffold2541:17579-23320(+) / protein_length=483 / sequence_SO=supercontig / SO=protein_coding / is_pseudo=false
MKSCPRKVREANDGSGCNLRQAGLNSPGRESLSKDEVKSLIDAALQQQLVSFRQLLFEDSIRKPLLQVPPEIVDLLSAPPVLSHSPDAEAAHDQEAEPEFLLNGHQALGVTPPSRKILPHAKYPMCDSIFFEEAKTAIAKSLKPDPDTHLDCPLLKNSLCNNGVWETEKDPEGALSIWRNGTLSEEIFRKTKDGNRWNLIGKHNKIVGELIDTFEFCKIDFPILLDKINEGTDRMIVSLRTWDVAALPQYREGCLELSHGLPTRRINECGGVLVMPFSERTDSKTLETILEMKDDNAVSTTPWEEKSEIAIFRGGNSGYKEAFPLWDAMWERRPHARSGGETTRQYLQRLCSEHLKGYCDASITKKTWQEITSHKYIISSAGNTFASLEVNAYASGSLLLKHTHINEHWLSFFFHPWIHYVPVNFDYSDLKEKITWAREHDEAAKLIAANAKRRAEELYNSQTVHCYTAAALEVAAELLVKPT